MTRVDFNIPAEPLASALLHFAQQANLSLGYGGFDIAPYRCRALSGHYTPQEALTRLLLGTPFSFSFIDPDTVKLSSRSEQIAHGSAIQLPTISVTATKRDADTQHVPLSVTAISPDVLSTKDITTFRAVSSQIVGVSQTNLGLGQRKIFIRGVSDGTFSDRVQSTIGVYLDETPITYNDPSPDLRLIDMERLEVLRGPQGTLFGAGSLGGAYRMITKKPELDSFSGDVKLTGAITEGAPDGAIDGWVNLPLVKNKLALRVVGYRESMAGYIDDVRLGTKRINGSDTTGTRVAARLALSDNWTADASYVRQVQDLHDSQYYFADLAPMDRANFVTEPRKDLFRTTNLTIHGDLNWGEVISSTAYVQRNIEQQQDATLAVPTLVGQDRGPSPYRSADDIKMFTQETRLVADERNRKAWLFGTFYSLRDEAVNARITTPFAADPNLRSVPLYTNARSEKVEQFALFGEASYEILDHVKLTGGLRIARNEIRVDATTNGEANGGLSLSGGGSVQNDYTPALTLSYEPDPALFFYIKEAKGFRVGGVNINTPLNAIDPAISDEGVTRFDSDSLWSTEAGVKSSWFDDRLSFNASVYHLIWSGIQTDQLLPNGFTFVGNAGSARNTGVEFEARARPLKGLDISATFFWNDTELTTANPFLDAQKGNRLPGVADLSASLSASYEFPLAGAWRGRFAANYSYVGTSTLTFATNSPTMGNYSVSDVGIWAEREKFRIGLVVNNIEDETGNSFAFGNPFSLAAHNQIVPIEPRTVGLVLDFAF